MHTIYDHRRDHLERLVQENSDKSGRGGLSAVSRISDVGRTTLDNILHRKPVDGPHRVGKFHQMGEASARKIEEAFGLPRFSMDQPGDISVLDKAVETEAQKRLLLAVMSRLDSFVFSDSDCDRERERLDRLFPLPEAYELRMPADVRDAIFGASH